jgi:hypothetical protein
MSVIDLTIYELTCEIAGVRILVQGMFLLPRVCCGLIDW